MLCAPRPDDRALHRQGGPCVLRDARPHGALHESVVPERGPLRGRDLRHPAGDPPRLRRLPLQEREGPLRGR
eukprot:6866393-Pyramimonas_sp.AAC.1